MSKYEEHDKLGAVMDRSQAIGEFLETSGYILCKNQRMGSFNGVDEYALVPVSKSINEVLADYFDIDLKKIEAEKRQMIEELRRMQ